MIYDFESEDTVDILYSNSELGVIISTAISINNMSDYYVLVCNNAYNNDGTLKDELEMKFVRVSIIKSSYIDNNKFTEKEKIIFNKIIHDNWDNLLNMIKEIYEKWYKINNFNFDYNIQCPDYMQLDIEG